MKCIKYFCRVIRFSTLIVLCSSSCVPRISVPILSASQIPTQVTHFENPSISITPHLTNTIIASSTATYILKTPTSTYTQVIPTWTPLPTIDPTEAQSFVMDLLVGNSGCQLPCWWGFTPGITKWNEAKQYLLQFAQISGGISNEDPSILVQWLLIPVPKSVFHISMEHLYIIKNGVIKTMEVHIGRGVPIYRLSNFLSTYGKPSEIQISTFSNPNPPDYLPFLITLFYPDQGIYAGFGPEETEIKNGMVRGCKLDNSAAMFGLWSPDQTMNFQQAANEFREGPEYITYSPLEITTNMDVNTFYETFRKPNSPVCIETPVELWPER
jgi:hypothetical protein